MSYYLHNDLSKARLAIFYRNFQLKPVGKGTAPHSHIGLGVNAMHTAKVLRRNKIRTDVFGVWNPDDVEAHLSKPENQDITHAIVEAPWIPTKRLELLTFKFPNVHFICRSHSQIGFLQVEAGAINLLREYALLQDSVLNFTLAANSARFCEFFETAYRSKCLFLPNLYDNSRARTKDPYVGTYGQTLRISSFGAIRLLKNHTSAAAAALMVARQRNSDLEFHMSVNREEHGNGVLQAVRNMFKDLPWAKLVEVPWQPWAQFRHTVANMDLCIQVSATETFNIVTADACAEGVPTVIGEAIDWLPNYWVANIDDAEDIARVANTLLSDPKAGQKAIEALDTYVFNSVNNWLKYLASE